MKLRGTYRLPLSFVAAALVLLVAAMAGGSLWVLHRMQNQLAHATATRAVVDRGGLIASYLADRATEFSGGDDRDWARFSGLVESLHTIESGMQYVSVLRDGVIVYHEQPGGLAPETTEAAEPGPAPIPGELKLSRKLIHSGDDLVPVVAFSLPFTATDGMPFVLEVGLRRETVSREEQTAAAAIGAIFHLSLITILVSFGVCAALVAWIMRRESLRLRQRREEEHLAFSGVLANGIVHDFRNPMSSLKLDVQMLQRQAARGADCSLERLGQLATRIGRTVERMDNVFTEFLYLSRPATDQREPVDLGAVARECAELTTPRFEQAGVRLSVETPSNGPVGLASAPSLRRALVNILVNAEQFSPPGTTARVRVSADAHRAFIDVQDEGPGVPRTDRRRIFDMFVSSRPEGTGLGLFLARTALERSGGSLQLMDKPDRGSWFRITLPLAAGNAAPAPRDGSRPASRNSPHS